MAAAGKQVKLKRYVARRFNAFRYGNDVRGGSLSALLTPPLQSPMKSARFPYILSMLQCW